jgi:hypothetical protein
MIGWREAARPSALSSVFCRPCTFPLRLNAKKAAGKRRNPTLSRVRSILRGAYRTE